MEIDVKLAETIHDLLLFSENGNGSVDVGEVRSARIALGALLDVERSGKSVDFDGYKLDMSPEAFAELEYVDCMHPQWRWFSESAEDSAYSQHPEPIRCLNVSIGGELWDFTLNVTETEPAQDFCCYGKWFACSIYIDEKVRK